MIDKEAFLAELYEDGWEDGYRAGLDGAPQTHKHAHPACRQGYSLGYKQGGEDLQEEGS